MFLVLLFNKRKLSIFFKIFPFSFKFTIFSCGDLSGFALLANDPFIEHKGITSICNKRHYLIGWLNVIYMHQGSEHKWVNSLFW